MIINHYKDASITPCGSGCSSQDIYPTAQHVYWTIPGSKFKNNLLSSYGSQIKFTLDFDGRTNNFNGLYCASIRGASTTLFATCDQVGHLYWMISNLIPMKSGKFKSLKFF